MKFFMMSILIILSTSALAINTSEFERGFNAGLKSCSEDNYYVCSAHYPNARLKRRSSSRGQAIKELYDYCYSPSRNVHRYECEAITDRNLVSCIKL